ncbi:MAG TPA: hypothetical protein PKD12_16895 [Nitrospira sp.]|nr:hypothetical protein [Nitrospira sp.]
MAGKASFSPDEWSTLRDTPHLVAAAAMIVGNSGLGTIKEGYATAKSILEAQQSPNGLIKELASRGEIEEAQKSIRNQIELTDPEGSKAKLRTQALAKSTAALKLLATKGESGDMDAYKDWLIQIADAVTKAAKEGGILGIGGERVSAGEQAFLKDLSTSIQI